MSAEARVEFDPMLFGVRIALSRKQGGRRQLVHWGELSIQEATEGGAVEMVDDAWLRLQDDDARALYEGLAEFFGHAGHDTRALRKDYDAERARVDKFIAHVTGARS